MTTDQQMIRIYLVSSVDLKTEPILTSENLIEVFRFP